MRKALLLGLVLTAALATAGAPAAQPVRPASTSWESDWFVSPTHNIHCRWFWTEGLIACTTENNGRMAGVTVWGQPFARWGTGGRRFPSGPVLSYGYTYTGRNASGSPTIRCWSRSTGMTCKSLKTGAGFWIAREGYRLF